MAVTYGTFDTVIQLSSRRVNWDVPKSVDHQQVFYSKIPTKGLPPSPGLSVEDASHRLLDEDLNQTQFQK